MDGKILLLCFVITVGLDVLPEAWFRWDYLYLIEDGAKLFGIVSWLAYFANVSAALLAPAPVPAGSQT